MHDTGVAAYPAQFCPCEGKDTRTFSMRLVPEVLSNGCDTTSPKSPKLPKYGQGVWV